MAVGAIMHKPGALSGIFNRAAPPPVGMGRAVGGRGGMPFKPPGR